MKVLLVTKVMDLIVPVAKTSMNVLQAITLVMLIQLAKIILVLLPVDAAERGFAGVDNDKCATESHSCDIHTTCTDTDGSCTFACNDDYENSPGGIGHTNDCINIDECLRETDGYACTNYDECSNHDHNDCDKEHTTCDDTEGAYTCTCEIGCTNTDDDSATCYDIDKCADETHDVETPLVITNVTVTVVGHQSVEECVGASADCVTAEQALIPISIIGILFKHTNVTVLQVDSLVVPTLVWYVRVMMNVPVPVQMVSLPCIAATKMPHVETMTDHIFANVISVST